MNLATPTRATHSFSRLMPLVVLSGLAVAVLASNVPAFWAVAAVGATLFLIVFFQRPDIGLLIVLFLRSVTDISVGRWESLKPGSVLSSPMNVGLVLILILAGGFFLLARGLPFLRLPGGRAFTVLVLVGAVSLVHATVMVHLVSVVYGINQWLRVVSILAVYALAASVFRTPRHVQRVIDVLAASFVIPAGLAFYQLAAGQIPVRGAFLDQNALGVFLVLIFGVFLCQAFVQSGVRRLLAVGILASSATLLVATFSRSSWIGAMTIVLTIGMLRKRVFLVLAPLVAVIGIGMVPSIADRLADPFGGSFADRVGIWRTTGPQWMAATHDDAGAVSTLINRLTGTGPGSVPYLVRAGYGYANAEHSDYLLALYEYGVVGLVAYVLVYLAIMRNAYRAWRRSVDGQMGAIALSFVAVIPAFMIMSLTSNIFGLTQNQIYFWTLAGLTTVVGRLAAGSRVPSSSSGRSDAASVRNARTTHAALTPGGIKAVSDVSG